MSDASMHSEQVAQTSSSPILDALPHPLLLIDPQGRVVEANMAAESFFRASAPVLRRHPMSHFVPFGSPLLLLISQVRDRGAPVNEYKVDIGSPRIGPAAPPSAASAARLTLNSRPASGISASLADRSA